MDIYLSLGFGSYSSLTASSPPPLLFLLRSASVNSFPPLLLPLQLLLLFPQDSATLFTVVRWLSEAAKAMQLTIMASLLQPPPEVFGLFDDVLLLTEG